MCRPRLALALKTDELGVCVTLHPIGQIYENERTTTERPVRTELELALANVLLLQARTQGEWSLGAE